MPVVVSAHDAVSVPLPPFLPRYLVSNHVPELESANGRKRAIEQLCREIRHSLWTIGLGRRREDVVKQFANRAPVEWIIDVICYRVLRHVEDQYVCKHSTR